MEMLFDPHDTIDLELHFPRNHCYVKFVII